jgi:D-3-phosphoglycerate dehydrogenase
VESERRQRSISGTLFGGTRPRLVEINEIPVEAELSEHMLYTTNRDKPGVIGQLGQALGDANVNVATFHLGRIAPGEDAIALIQIDQPVGQDLIARITALPNVTQAKSLRF